MKVFLLCLLALCDGRIVKRYDKDLEDATNWLNANITPKPSLEPTAPKDACETADKKIGKCVKVSDCDEDKEDIDFEELSIYRASNCHYLMKCCPLNETRTEPKPVEVPQGNSGCGWSNPGAHVFRQKSSDIADFGEFPWMVALLKKAVSANGWDQKDFLGGGSLIHPSVVMTIAHKIYKLSVNEIKCRAGEWDTQTTNEFYPHQERGVKKMIVHPDFFAKRSYNNIALLILESPFNLTGQPHMGLGCLGRALPPAGTTCYSMGWGKNFYNSNEYAVALKKVPLPLVDKDKCQYSLRNTFLGTKYNLHNSQICAGGQKGIDTCTGDGGSPLVCELENDTEDSRYAIYGMVAFGIGCNNDIPGVYTNVPLVYDWVVETVAAEGFPSTTFMY